MKKLFLLTLLVPVLAGAQALRLGSEPVPRALAASLDGDTAPPQAAPPASVDLSPLFPLPGFQGDQNSCVGWALAYGAKSYQENLERGWGASTPGTTFSPAFVYNQINQGRDGGSSLVQAADLAKNLGIAPLSLMPYNPSDYRTQPGRNALAQAGQFQIASYRTVSPADTLALKTALSQGLPVVFGMKIRQNFLEYKSGVYNNPSGAELGGHAMVAVGYDDGKRAFRIMNSWGDRWGDKGYAWVEYGVFGRSVHTALVLRDKVEGNPGLPSAVEGLQASQGTHQAMIEVRWNAVPGAETYLIKRSLDPKGPFTQAAEVGGTLYRDTSSLTEETFYYYTVAAKTAQRTGPDSSLAQGFLQTQGAPGIPSGLRSQFHQGSLRILWTPVDNAQEYRIYRFDPKKENYVLTGSSRDPGFQDPAGTREPGSRWYVVTALRGTKESPASRPLSVTVSPAPVAPLPPSDAQASGGTDPRAVILTWNASSGAVSYEVRRYEPQSKSWNVLGSPQGNQYRDENPGSGVRTYTVTALGEGGRSAPTAYLRGWLKNQTPPAAPVKPRLADQNYRDAAEKTADFSRENFFKGDDFFADSDKFFDNFVPQDFFFVDTEKFFEVEADFFTNEKDFFD